MLPLTRLQVREIDRRAIDEFGMTGLVLMENAGRGCVDVLCGLGCRGPVVVACGKGNNAGDGFVIARHLDLRGVSVRVLLLSAPAELRGDAAANHATLARCGLPVLDLSADYRGNRLDELLMGAEWIVDALLGTGARGAPRPPWDDVIRRLNEHPARKLAVDLPSGLDCDTGIASAATIRADHTCTFVSRKAGFDNPSAASYLGQVHVLDIGAPRRLVEEIAGS